MPLRAYIDNEEVISIDQTDEQWVELKKRLKSKESLLTLPCCRQEGFLRKSRNGLKHFVHLKSDKNCDWKPESAEHLKAKIEIIEACKLNGWKAIPEYSETNWIADVLAIKNDKRIAFEVQWSRQSYETTKFRQDRYKDSDVRGCWFFRTAPKELRNYDDSLIADNDLPAFRIFKDENSNIISQLRQTQLPLRDLVDSLLKRKLRFCHHVRLKSNQEVTILFFQTSCWKCKKSQHCYTVEQNLLSVCNQDFHIMGSMWDSDDIDKSPKIYDTVKRFIASDKEKNLKVGQLKKRYSKTVHDSYLSHGCFYCDAIFGDFYLNTEKMEGQNDPNSIRLKENIDLGTITEEEQHWCYSESRQFCD
jgi:hypothetical protein